MDVRTTRTVRERMVEWEMQQESVWQEIERMSTLFGEIADLDREEVSK